MSFRYPILLISPLLEVVTKQTTKSECRWKHKTLSLPGHGLRTKIIVQLEFKCGERNAF